MFKKLGFTMIELLIVIAVLGILAVAVLASINPIEQINRGRDTGTRSDSEQLISAIDRFYAAKNYYPWMTNGVSPNTWTDPAGTAIGVSAGDLVQLNDTNSNLGVDNIDILTALSSGGTAEVKSSFTSRLADPAAANYLSVYNSGTSGESTYACFVPKSASFREEAWNRCSTGTPRALNGALPSDYPPGACPDDGTCAQAATSNLATSCYICLP